MQNPGNLKNWDGIAKNESDLIIEHKVLDEFILSKTVYSSIVQIDNENRAPMLLKYSY